MKQRHRSEEAGVRFPATECGFTTFYFNVFWGHILIVITFTW